MTLTPEQFDKLALKSDLTDFVTKDDLKNQLTEIKSEILSAIDAFAKSNSNLKEEFVANIGAHDRMQESINKHEKVLTHLSPELMN